MSKDYTPGESRVYHDGCGLGIKDSYDLVREKCIKDFVVIDDNCQPGKPKHHPYMEDSKLGRMIIAMNYM